MTEVYFFDTYAIIEIIKGNQNYENYKHQKIVTTFLNLIELHYSILKDYGPEIAEVILNKYSQFTVGINLDTIKKSNEFRYKNKKSKFSTADVIGYFVALQKGIKFLTGDIQFKNLDNVEFVK